LDNKPKTLCFSVFGCQVFVFLPNEVDINKLALYSELIIFIGYKNNGYCFICYIQGNIIFCSTHPIFNKELFSKYTDSHTKESKLYDNLLNKISLEVELLVPSCYELRSLELDKRTNSCIRVNIRELDKELFTKWSTLYTPTDGLC